MKTCAAIVGLAVALGACAGDEPADEATPTVAETTELASPTTAGYSRECGDTMSAAAQAAQDGQDAVEDVDPAIIACGSMDEFAAALTDHPDALDGTDVETGVRERCESSEDPEEVTGSAICQEIGEEPAS